MLRHDDRVQRFTQRVGLALQRAKLIAEDVGILRRENDKATLGQPAGKLVVGGVDLLGIGHVGGPPLKAVLANDDRTLFTRLDPFGHKQNAVGEHVGKTSSTTSWPEYSGLVVNLPRSCGRRQPVLLEAADHGVIKMLAIALRGGFPLFHVARGAIGRAHHCVARGLALAQQVLRVVVDLVE